MNLLLERTESRLPADPRVSWLWESEFKRSGESWDARLELWDALHTKPLSAFRQRDALKGFIEARNAIAHGLGNLTRRQKRKLKSTASKLQNAGMRVNGQAVTIEAADVERCAEVVQSFIEWLDAA